MSIGTRTEGVDPRIKSCTEPKRESPLPIAEKASSHNAETHKDSVMAVCDLEKGHISIGVVVKRLTLHVLTEYCYD